MGKPPNHANTPGCLFKYANPITADANNRMVEHYGAVRQGAIKKEVQTARKRSGVPGIVQYICKEMEKNLFNYFESAYPAGDYMCPQLSEI